MTIKKIFLLLILNVAINKTIAQEVTIKILDNNNTPVVGATVVIKVLSDSLSKFSGFTDDKGVLKVSLQRNYKYIVTVTSIGYVKYQQIFDTLVNEIIINLLSSDTQLDEIKIRARKNLFTYEEDKLVIRPETIAGSSSNTIELLEQIPGLFIDEEGYIYINSSSPAQVYINSRDLKMSPKDIAPILKSLPPSSIEKIEVLRTPSAKMEASSAGGVVNIILKKGVKLGLTGTINIGLNKGRFSNQNIGFRINNNIGKKSNSFSINLFSENSYDSVSYIRNINQNKLSSTTYNVSEYRGISSGYNHFRDISKKIEIGSQTQLTSQFNNNLSNNFNAINSSSIYNNNVNNNNKYFSLLQGFNATFKFDSASNLKMDYSFSFRENHTSQNIFLDKSKFGNNELMNYRRTHILQVDFDYYLKNKFHIETGLKSNFSFFNNSAAFFINSQGNLVSDNNRSNIYDLNESLSGFYLQGSKKIKRDYLLKVGLRLENTVMSGVQKVPFDTSFAINHTGLFPYLFLSRKIVKIANEYELRAYLVARRTIQRPVYDNLNPGVRYIDNFFYEKGNPNLKPQFTDNYELNISFQDTPIFAVGKNYKKGILTSIVFQDPNNDNITFRSFDNIGTNEETYLRLLAAKPPGDLYFFVFGGEYIYNNYNGFLDSEKILFKRGSTRLYTYHKLKIKKIGDLSLNAFILLNGQRQFYQLGNFGQVSLGYSKNLFNQKIGLNIQINDLLFTNKYTLSLNQGKVDLIGRRNFDSRRLSFSLIYNFGKLKKESENMFNIPSNLTD